MIARLLRTGVLLVLMLAVLTVSASGEQEEGLAWQPTPPTPETSDWIQLVSGEWLKGDLKFMREEVLEFDSDELDTLEFDWEDIVEFRSPRIYSYVFENRIVVLGTAVIRGEDVIIREEEKVRKYERSRLLAIIPGAQSKRDLWSGKLSLGMSLRSGNTDEVEYSSIGFIRRQGAFARFRVDYNGSFGKIEGTETTNSHRGNAKLDLFIFDRFYITPVFTETYYDKFQNIDFRLTVGSGVGYDVIKQKEIECEVELGGAYQQTQYISVAAGEDSVEETGTITSSIRLETEPTSKIDFDLYYSIQVGVPDTENIFHHTLAVLSLEFFRDFDLDLSLIWDRVENPVPDEDGRTPEQDDFQTSINLALEF